MITGLTAENFFFPLPIEVKLPIEVRKTSDSFVSKTDKMIEQEIIDSKFSKLEKIIGGDLFSKLSHSDRIFMIETAGSIDFGHPIDLEKISQEIKNNDTF